MQTEKKTYYATAEGHIAGAYRKPGADFRLTEQEAKYLLMNGSITGAAPVKEDPIKREPDPATLDRKTR